MTANFLTEMRGPLFLQVYASVIGAVLVFCWWRIREIDGTRNLEPPLVPSRPDPYEIACLRGGANELARLMALSLVERGFLEIDESKFRIRRNTRTRDGQGPLTRDETKFVEWCGEGRDASAMFGSNGAVGAIQPIADRYRTRFEQDQLILDRGAKATRRNIALAGLTVIVLLGLTKLLAALSIGRRNVGFLILMMVVGSVVALAMAWPKRLSSRGKRYLARLRTAFSDLKAGGGFASPRPAHSEAGFATSGVLLGAGLFGLGVLAGGPYDRFRQMYARSGNEVTASSGCGSSDSGGGDGGSSGCGGGGGCGGCGGGGD